MTLQKPARTDVTFQGVCHPDTNDVPERTGLNMVRYGSQGKALRMNTLPCLHNATRIIETTGLLSDGRHLQFGQTCQIGFEHWVLMEGIAGSL